jgi:Uma2 family endonuclease
MPEARQRKHWTWDEFLAWEADQPVKYELVDGEVYAMACGTSRHDTICNNLRASLHGQLRRKPCRMHGPDLKVKAGLNGRYPDALIDCGPPAPGSQVAQEPVAVCEVLSRSTAWFDQTRKLRDYDATPSVRTYALISQDEKWALVYTRDADGRLSIRDAEELEGAEAATVIPALGVRLAFAELYEGVAVD